MSKQRTERLKAFLSRERDLATDKRLKGDLNALLALVIVAEAEMPLVGNVPEWHNHENERTGKPNLLGDVASTYALWVEDAEVDHDGACQLAEMATHMRTTINALDRLVFSGNR